MTGNADEQRSLRVYASNWRTLLRDVDRVLRAAAGEMTEQGPTRIVGRVELDAFEAHVGATKRVKLYEPWSREAPAVAVPPKVRNFDPLPVGFEQIAIVRIVPAQDRFAVRAAALTGLLLAIAFLLFLLTL